MIALVIWILAWFVGGADSFGVGDGYFWFLCACTALAFCQSIAISRIGQTTVLVAGKDQEVTSE